MAKNFIKKYLPDPDLIRNHKSMQIFGKFLHDGNLWHLHRRSARGAFAAGLFAALMPNKCFMMGLLANLNRKKSEK